MTESEIDIVAQVLVVDDEPGHAEVLSEALRRLGHVCTTVHSLAEAEEELRLGRFDLIVTDLVMDGPEDGLSVLAAAREHQPDAEVIMVTAHGDVPTCKRALQHGAYDFIEKPIDLDELRARCSNALRAVALRSQNTQLREQLDDRFGFEGIIGQSEPVRRLITMMRQVAPSQIPVLITGESGTGKELVAKAIHNHSKRSRRTFAPLNCAGLSESILEDELFGHVKGAFTGAERAREGRFEYADGGTLFLDEVGDMPAAMQAKLLRVLESGEVVRLGDNTPKHVDVRLVSATNRDLASDVRAGRFREDLYFRIKGVELRLPPLRERQEDIPLLVQAFVHRFATQLDREPPRIDAATLSALQRYQWPGNVRQLMNVVQNMLVIADGDVVEPRHLPPEIAEATDAAEGRMSGSAGMTLEQIEKHAIRDALQRNEGNREATARMLGIGERTLYRKLKEYGLR